MEDDTADPADDGIDLGLVDWLFGGDVDLSRYTPDELRRLAWTLARPCTDCGARAGAWCVDSATGEPITEPDDIHAGRTGRHHETGD